MNVPRYVCECSAQRARKLFSARFYRIIIHPAIVLWNVCLCVCGCDCVEASCAVSVESILQPSMGRVFTWAKRNILLSKGSIKRKFPAKDS